MSEKPERWRLVAVVTLCVAAGILLAWWSVLDLVLVALAALVTGVACYLLGYQRGYAQAEADRRARRQTKRSSSGRSSQ